jgi:hypothetical protein
VSPPTAKTPLDSSSPGAHHKSRIYQREVTGLIVVAVLLLILTVLRFWHNLAWSLR